MSTTESVDPLVALRNAVAAKLAYWQALTALENSLTGGAELTNRQSDQLTDEVDALACGLPSGHTVDSVTPDHVLRVRERVLG